MRTRIGLMSVFIGLAAAASADEIRVGGQPIDVPIPEGFVELTPEFSPYYEAMSAYVSPTNHRHLMLITQADAEAIRRGEDVAVNRRLTLETAKHLDKATVTEGMFTEIGDSLESEFEAIYAEVDDNIPSIFESGNESLSDTFETDVDVEFEGMMPLPVHLREDRAVAYSAMLTIRSTLDGQDYGAQRFSVTNFMLHAGGKVIFLYAHGSEEDLEWGREIAGAWGQAILAANPRDVSRTERVVRAIDWGKVLMSALIAAAVSGLIAFVAGFVKKRRED